MTAVAGSDRAPCEAGLEMKQRWRPTATLTALRRRAAIIADLRQFFAQRDVLEVSTPILSASGPRDPHMHLVRACFGGGDGRCFYLQPSPESAMKRLLAAGSGAIYQLAPAMRAAERGQRHNPEFMMLEWYRPGFNLDALMDEVDALLLVCLNAQPGRRTTYQAEFMRQTGLDPFSSTSEELANLARTTGLTQAASSSRDQLLDFLFCRQVEPNLGDGVVHVCGFPPEQAAMAQISHGVAQRLEVYVNGLELANGYLELTDESEQRRRFEAQGEEREQRGFHVPPMDEALLMALRHGLPAMCGIALGVDRLIMLATGTQCIDDVLTFPLERA